MIKKTITILFFIFLVVLSSVVVRNIYSDKSIAKETLAIKENSHEKISTIIYSGDSDDKFPYLKNKTHWWHMPIVYTFVNSFNGKNGEKFTACPSEQILRVKNAFDIIENSTKGVVKFKEDKIYGDILIFCYNQAKPKKEYIKEGEAMPKIIGNVIAGGNVYFYTHLNCGNWPDVEIHEILHLFDYEHINNTQSIMYPYSKVCDLNNIDKEITDDLIETYS